MANETIELLKNYEPKKLDFPAAFQQKFDGVPVRIFNVGGNAIAYTRQGEQVLSIQHILKVAKYFVPTLGSSFVGELYIPGVPFKDIGGMVRDTKKQQPNLQMYVFDFDLMDKPEYDWWTRRSAFANCLDTYLAAAGQAPSDIPIKLIPAAVVRNDTEVQETFKMLLAAFPKAEGAVLHSLAKPFQPGKRCWGTQRIKPVPTIDLRIINFEEAISENGTPLGMVGRLNAEFSRMQPQKAGSIPLLTTALIGIGPGALTHDQRKALWMLQKQGKWKPKIAEIKYMRDETYAALRQPTFVRFRLDKAVPDIAGEERDD